MVKYLRSVCAASSTGGISALVITNLGSFEALVGDMHIHTPGSDILRDFVMIESKIAGVLRSVDPRDISAVDSLLEGIDGIEDQICCAVSIACCKAGARHKGMSLYRYFSEICQVGNKDKKTVSEVLSGLC